MLKNFSRIHIFLPVSQGIVRELIVLGCLAVLSPVFLGCQSSRAPYWQDAPTDHRQRHPIIVTDGTATLTLYARMVSRGYIQFGQEQELSIKQFMGRYAQQGKGGVLAVVTVPGSMQTVRKRRRGCGMVKVRVNRDRAYLMSVRRQLIQAGIPSHLLTVQKDTREGEGGRVQVRFTELRGRVATRCGLWPTDLAGAAAIDSEGNRSIGTYDNKPYWNFGCVSQSNWASQVDNPRDFIQMRAETLGDSVKSLETIKKYRAGDATP